MNAHEEEKNQEMISDLDKDIQRLRQLAHYVIEERENEIRRQAREVHDKPSQVLTQLSFLLYQLKTGVKDDSIIQEAVSLVKEISTEIRRIYQDSGIAMLDHVGLEDTLEWTINRFQQTSAIPLQFYYSCEVESIPLPVSRAVLRMIEEFLHHLQEIISQPLEATISTTGDTTRLYLAFTIHGSKSTEDLLPEPGLSFIIERARMANGRVEPDPANPGSLRFVFSLT